MKKKCLLILVFMYFVQFAGAQDLHYSQFNASPLNINPALTGLFNADFRLILNHRNQWSSITAPYETYTAAADMNFQPGKGDIVGIGLLFNGDKAGDVAYTSLQLSPSISYTKALYSNTLFLTYGIQAGIIQRHFNPNELIFDKQYNGDAFDPGLSSGEHLIATTATAFDAGTGLNAFFAPKDGLNMNGGIAVFHFNKPGFAFTNGSFTQIAPRIMIHASSTIYMSNGIVLLPGCIIQKQGPNSEYNVGSYIKAITIESVATAIYGGVWFRLKDYDAVILSTRLDCANLSIGISYDFNTSRLATASEAQGGLELSLICLFNKTKKTKIIQNRCPVFF